MGITVQWDNAEKTIIRYDFEGRWTWDEFSAAAEEAFAMTRSVVQRVDTISNFQPEAVLPPNALFHFRRAMANAPTNRGMTVIVGGSTFIKTLVAVFSRAYKQFGERLALADTLEQARALLAERRGQSPAGQPSDSQTSF